MQILGHSAPPVNLWTENLLTDQPLALCPLRTLQLADETDPARTREVARYMDHYYPAFRDGHLLVGGGIAEQPARYLELIQLVRRVNDEMEAKYLKLRPKEPSL
jgi:hypothetical protein